MSLKRPDEKVIEQNNEMNYDEVLTQGVSSERITHATEVIQDRFNLNGEGYAVTGFKDKGVNLTLSMSNADFDITVVIKDTIKFNI
jgi:hypothetical protein